MRRVSPAAMWIVSRPLPRGGGRDGSSGPDEISVGRRSCQEGRGRLVGIQRASRSALCYRACKKHSWQRPRFRCTAQRGDMPPLLRRWMGRISHQ